MRSSHSQYMMARVSAEIWANQLCLALGGSGTSGAESLPSKGSVSVVLPDEATFSSQFLESSKLRTTWTAPMTEYTQKQVW